MLKLKSLTELALPPAVTNEQLASVAVHLPNLRSLVIRKAELITDILPISRLEKLDHVYFSGVKALRDLSPLAGLHHLKHLSVTFSAVEDLSPLSKLEKLNSLVLWGSRNLTDLTPLSDLKNLRSLGLNGCHGIHDLTPLSGLANLQRLGLANMKGLTDLSPLYGLRGLKRLDLTNSKNIKNRQFEEVKRTLPKCSVIGPNFYPGGRTG